MTARNEKPSPTESSTDTIIGALEICSELIENHDVYAVDSSVLREAADRLDKLERELFQLRGEK